MTKEALEKNIENILVKVWKEEISVTEATIAVMEKIEQYTEASIRE